jgi:hypothetical protein
VTALIAALLGLFMQTQAPAPRTVDKGDISNIDEATQVLVRTPEEWAALWRRHAPQRPLPPVDFSREMVAAVFMGSRPNAGFSTTILATMEVKGVLVVRYKETIPSRDTVTAQIITAPYHIIAFPKATVTDVQFKKE